MFELTPLRQTAHADLTKLFQRASKVSSFVVMLLGLVVLLGWQLPIPWLTGSLAEELVPVSTSSAVAFIIAGVSLNCLGWRTGHPSMLRLSQVLAIAVILFGLIELSETQFNWHINSWFAQTLPNLKFWLAPNWVPISTGLNFALIGNALLLSSLSQRWLHRLAQLFTLLAALIAVSALINNVYPIGLSPPYPAPPMALITALTFLILGVGIQSLHLDDAVMEVVTIAGGSSEAMVCQLLFAAIVFVVLEAFVMLWRQPQTASEVVFNLSVLAIKTVLIFTLLVGWSISLLTRIQRDYRQAEAVVDESLLWLQLAQESANLGRWDWQPATDQMRWCARQEELFGLRPDTFEGTQAAFLNLVHPEDRNSVREKLTRAWKFQHEYFDEFRVVWKDGTVHWLLSVGRCFCNEAGEMTRISGICLDITEHQEIQEQRHQLFLLEQAARVKAEAANRMKDEFLSVLTHEIRTPLNSVLGWLKLLQTRPLNVERTAQGLEALGRSAQTQAQILEDLLDMARVIQGKLQLHTRPTDLQSVTEAAIEVICPAAKAKQIHISSDVEAPLPELTGDPERLQQIIWNLLSNAVKFTPAQGRVNVVLTQQGTQVEILVSDNGKGISPEFLPYVFDRFRQEDSTLTRRYGGMGLGLALVRYLVELHGGTVEAASEGLGKGATFTVRLPLQLDP
jgi:PAS domain S-box-containing protein